MVTYLPLDINNEELLYIKEALYKEIMTPLKKEFGEVQAEIKLNLYLKILDVAEHQFSISSK
jgi:hypothetical protein